MKVPSLIASIDRDLEAGHAAVIQIVSTSEALMDRRLAEIPVPDWGDLSYDITPRENVLDYLAHSFPTQLYKVYSDENGDLQSRPVVDEHGNPVQSREAVERSYWREASSEEFRRAWEAEVASLPELTESTFHIVTGLLLPVWNRLPDEAARVYRLQTADGECVIGRLVSPASATVLNETTGATRLPLRRMLPSRRSCRTARGSFWRKASS